MSHKDSPTDSTALQAPDPLGQFPAIARRAGPDCEGDDK